MARLLGTINKQSVKFYKVGRKNGPFAIVDKKLYYTPEDRFIADISGEYEFILYDDNGTQTYGFPEYLDPDLTKVYLDHAKQSGGKASKLGGLANIKTNTIIGIVIVILLAYGLIGGLVL